MSLGIVTLIISKCFMFSSHTSLSIPVGNYSYLAISVLSKYVSLFLPTFSVINILPTPSMSPLHTAHVPTNSCVDIARFTAFPINSPSVKITPSQWQRKPKGLTIFGLLKHVHQFLRDSRLAPVEHNFYNRCDQLYAICAMVILWWSQSYCRKGS